MPTGRIIAAKFAGKGIEPGEMHLVVATESGGVCSGPISWQAGEEQDVAKKFLKRAIIGLKSVGGFRYQEGDEPHPLDCNLAGRVMRVFGLSRSAASKLCEEFGEDPNFRDVHQLKDSNADTE